RVEHRRRVLRQGCDPPRANRPTTGLPAIQQFLAEQPHAPVELDPSPALPLQREPESRLPAARSADDGEHFTGGQRQVHPVQQDSITDTGAEPPSGQHRFAHFTSRPANAESTTRLMPTHSEASRAQGTSTAAGGGNSAPRLDARSGEK